MKSDEMLQAALAKAIMESVSAEVRDGVFKDVIMTHLMYTGDSKGRLTTAFESALGDAAKQIAKDVVNEPENCAKIKKALQESLDALLLNPMLLGKMVQQAYRGY